MDTDLRRPKDAGRMPELRQAVVGIELAMLTTVDRDARPHTRPVVVVAGEHDGELWLLTSVSSAPWDVPHGGPVSVAHATPTRWVSISGTAERVDEPQRLRALWTDGCATWFPRGPADPALRLLRVEVAVVETWDVISGKRTRLEIRDLACPEALALGALGDELEDELPAATDGAQGAPWSREQSGRLLLSLEGGSLPRARRH
jgi:general stress protein 26